METKICSECKKDLSVEKFYWLNKDKGYRHSYCKNCFAGKRGTNKHRLTIADIEAAGYTICRSGFILNKYNKVLLPGFNKQGARPVNLHIDKRIYSFLVHRLVGMKYLGLQNNQQIDHIDRKPWNNNVSNLRISNQCQNMMNAGKRGGSTSKYKGVNWHKSSKKFRAVIQHNGNINHLGIYNNEEDAARAYNEAAVKYHGEFALLNEIKLEKEI